ncbi:Protein of unknown function [Cotesia congregata]|uniref:EB domain-containing protein n=1 Tax=Cotesia congregata TaxID=51543 RepID=A0A8J2HCI4_COTCN|nr:Protein of unknown function [Cotesia congregata]
MIIKLQRQNFAKFVALIIICINLIEGQTSKDSRSLCAEFEEKCYFDRRCCNPDYVCKPMKRGSNVLEKRCLKPECYSILRKRLLGDACESSFDCHNVVFTMCTKENKCECQSHFIAVNNSRCMSPLNEFCLSDSDCLTDNSTCNDSQCKCKFDFRPTLSNKCEPKKLLKFCRNNEDCADIIHAKCSIDNECVCRENNVAVNDSVCLPAMNSFCWNNEPCAVENSDCIDKMPCKHDIDCVDMKNSECYMKKFCHCTENSIKLNETFCAPLLGGYCSNDRQCVPDNSLCVDNLCQCKTNFAPIAHYNSVNNYQTMLLLSVPLGRYCRADSECIDKKHRECSRDNKCVCKPNHISVNESTCLPVLDGFCITDDDCQPENSFCSNYYCRCKPDFLAISGDLCVLNDLAITCNYLNDCNSFGDYAICSSKNQCECMPNTKLYHDVCLAIIDGSCKSNKDCIVQHSKCTNGKCIPPVLE